MRWKGIIKFENIRNFIINDFDMYILETLIKNGLKMDFKELTQNIIGNLNIQATTIYKNISKLRKLGLIEVKVEGIKFTEVMLTEKGKKVYEKIKELVEILNDSL